MRNLVYKGKYLFLLRDINILFLVLGYFICVTNMKLILFIGSNSIDFFFVLVSRMTLKGSQAFHTNYSNNMCTIRVKFDDEVSTFSSFCMAADEVSPTTGGIIQLQALDEVSSVIDKL